MVNIKLFLTGTVCLLLVMQRKTRLATRIDFLQEEAEGIVGVLQFVHSQEKKIEQCVLEDNYINKCYIC